MHRAGDRASCGRDVRPCPAHGNAPRIINKELR
jgi:hypothetical protein